MRDEESTAEPTLPDVAPTSPLRLLIVGQETYGTCAIPASGVVTIGRSGDADIRISDESISRTHARLHISRGSEGLALEIEDLGSSNGTTVRGARLEEGQRTPISIGEVIDIGSVTVAVQRVPEVSRPRRIWAHGDFETRLEEECERARISGLSFALVRLDVESSHRSAESDLAQRMRPCDVIAADASGEYELLLFDLPVAEARAMVDRIKAGLASAGIHVRAGIATCPEDGWRPVDLLDRALERISSSPPPRHVSKIDSPSGHVQPVDRLLQRVAQSDVSVLILGETGVGKEVHAAMIHQRSRRADKTLLKLNCAALSESLLESELFGYEKGAFTGATQAKPGLFEAADGGTVFLDEFGELPLTIQAKLLRVLEDRSVCRLGSVKPRSIDVRFIAATNRDLEKQVELGAFRRDLYFRINVISVVVPPLRDRVDEIEPLAMLFARDALERSGIIREPVITRAALDLLRNYQWPGNIRELKNVMERAVLLAHDAPIDREHLPPERMSRVIARPSNSPVATEAPDKLNASEERKRILDALESAAGNQSRAAQILGMSRGTFLARLDAYGIRRPRKRQHGSTE